MKETSWDDCILSNSSVKISPDKGKAKSLIDTARGRIKFLEMSKLEEENINYIFEGYYSSIVELIHSIVLLKSYKVSNHICLGFFLKDIMKKERLSRLFDDCRYKRNSLVYYGRKMDLDTAKESISKSKELVKELKLILKKEL